MIFAEEKMRHGDRELQTDSSSGTYNGAKTRNESACS